MGKLDLVGKNFGRLLVVADGGVRTGKAGRAYRIWVCVCACGNSRRILADSLRSGETKSCGCSRYEHMGPKPRHGSGRRGARTPEYLAWLGMQARCHNQNCKDYRYYGGRGIAVHPEWRISGGFERFLAHVGTKPEPKRLYSLDRIDNEGNYESDNVRWATYEEQRKNRRPPAKSLL